MSIQILMEASHMSKPFYNIGCDLYCVSTRQTIDHIWFVIGAFGLGFIFLLYGISQNLVVLSGIGVALLLGGVIAIVSIFGSRLSK